MLDFYLYIYIYIIFIYFDLVLVYRLGFLFLHLSPAVFSAITVTQQHTLKPLSLFNCGQWTSVKSASSHYEILIVETDSLV